MRPLTVIVHKLWRRIRYLLCCNNFPKLLYTYPLPCDVVVFDRVSLPALQQPLLQKRRFAIIHCRGEALHINPRLLWQSLLLLRQTAGNPKYAYVLALLKAYRAKVVLTFIDNNNTMGALQHLSSATFISIQNGMRTAFTLQGTPPIKRMPLFYCYGQRDIDLYQSCHVKTQAFFPTGSLKGGYFLDNVVQKTAQTHYDLCLISQYISSQHTHTTNPLLLDGIQKITDYFFRYLQENPQLKACVALRGSTEHADETAYYRHLSQSTLHPVTLISQKGQPFATYQAAYDSQILVTYHSTLGFEALGWGKKVLFGAGTAEISPPHSWLFKEDSSTIIRLEALSYTEFCRKLKTLHTLSNTHFQQQTQMTRQYVMHTPDRPLYQILDETIEEILHHGKPNPQQGLKID